MKKGILILLYFLHSMLLFGQFPVEMYFDSYWRFSPKDYAKYSRHVDWDYKSQSMTGEFTDILSDTNIVITQGAYIDSKKNGAYKQFFDNGKH
jgi:hypothetical protein